MPNTTYGDYQKYADHGSGGYIPPTYPTETGGIYTHWSQESISNNLLENGAQAGVSVPVGASSVVLSVAVDNTKAKDTCKFSSYSPLFYNPDKSDDSSEEYGKDGNVAYCHVVDTETPVFTTAGESIPMVKDVLDTTPHVEDIVWLVDNKISAGWAENDGFTTFRPMNSVVRQDMAAFLRRLAVKNDIADAADWTPSAADWKKFKDVDKNTPHAEDILWLAHAGISEGWKESDGTYTFRGMSPVVRQDMAAFLKRLAVKANKADGITPVSNFKDVSDTTPHADDIAWLAGAKITEGWKESDGKYTFRGMSKVVRQDMAAFLHRLDTLLNK